MKRSLQTRSLLFACILSAPLLAITEAGCGGGTLPIGGDKPDAGSGAHAGTAGASGTGGVAGTGTAGTGTAGAAGTGTAGAGGSGAGGSDICSLPAESGPCLAAMPRWAFNPQTGMCEGFTYGGCGGNANNFATFETCVAACVPGGGEPCGAVRCAAGQTCCNPSCGICTAPGEGCITMECTDRCAPQDARGEGDCKRNTVGYKWDGLACIGVLGCECIGLGCSALKPTLEECMSAHAGCGGQTCPSERQALIDFILNNKDCDTSADCQALNVGCGITEDDCTGAVYVSKRADGASFEALRTDFVECTGGCGTCKRVNSGAACVNRRCTRLVAP